MGEDDGKTSVRNLHRAVSEHIDPNVKGRVEKVIPNDVRRSENPYDHDVPPYDGPEDECHCCIWDEGCETGQQNPSPQTIKRIQSDFAEKVEKALHGKLHPAIFTTVFDTMSEALQRQGGD
jgi:hypothetical protein